MNKKLIGLTAGVALFLAGCGAGTTDTQEVSVAVVSEVEVEVWEDIKARLAEEDITVNIEQFSDYVQPNKATQDGDIDINAFQHVAHLDNFNADNDGDLVSIGFTYVSPLGLYSDSLEDYNDIEDGAQIAIPNDVTNGGRALLLLEAIDLIEVDDAAGTEPTVNDITANPKNLEIVELDPSQTARSLPDVAAAVINTNFATDSGLNPQEDALFLDTDNIAEVNEIYKNVIATREADADNELYLRVVEEYQSEETAQLIEEVTNGNDVAAWD